MRAACQSISVEAVELLLLHAPNIMLLDSGGKTALDWARLTNNHQAVALLEQELQILIDTERKGITTHQNLVEKDQKIKLNESLWLELAVVIDHYDASEVRIPNLVILGCLPFSFIDSTHCILKSCQFDTVSMYWRVGGKFLYQ